jgi:glycosyltransferase involved in cell wall biosynthesis
MTTAMAVAAPVPARGASSLASERSERALRLAVFTTSYPRHPDDFAGRFVSDAVERLRELGHEVAVVGPGAYRDYGLASDGRGIVANVRRRPWLAPLLAVSMVRSLRRAARDADLVHAHWLAGAVVAALCGRPFVVTLHGSTSLGAYNDFSLCARYPRLVRAVLGRARAVICVSEALTEAVRDAGVSCAVFVPNGIAVPESAGTEAEPPEVLFAGRLTPEKGIDDLVRATEGLNLVVCGDGPLRHLVPQARGFLPRYGGLEQRYAAAAVVACPSRIEGFGVVCAEAMAHGKPVVAYATGGLVNLVRHGETGFLVEPGDVGGLRRALDRLLGDAALRRRLGEAGRARIQARYSWGAVIERTLEVYRDALRGRDCAGSRAPEPGSARGTPLV